VVAHDAVHGVVRVVEAVQRLVDVRRGLHLQSLGLALEVLRDQVD
jgi:hypothetical protein